MPVDFVMDVLLLLVNDPPGDLIVLPRRVC